MAIGFNPMMMGGPSMMGGMGPMGGMSQMFMMMQMMQMMQMMMSMMGSMNGGSQAGCGCCHQDLGNSMGLQPPILGGRLGPCCPMPTPFRPMPLPAPVPFQGGAQMPSAMAYYGGAQMPTAMPYYGGAQMPTAMPYYGGAQMPVPFSSGQNVPSISSAAMQGASPTGSRILQSIRSNPVPATPGYCYRGVKQHLGSVGVNLTGGSAYQAADQLAQRRDRFDEVSVSRSQLTKLPPGAVVVWNRSPGKPHGHISIATGDGREASDKIRNQMTNRQASYRVFIPK